VVVVVIGHPSDEERKMVKNSLLPLGGRLQQPGAVKGAPVCGAAAPTLTASTAVEAEEATCELCSRQECGRSRER
jgi:hypothetical protein